MNTLPEAFFKELILMTIQKEARWMEWNEEMEDFQLKQYLDDDIIEELSLYLCGYIPQLDMELAIQIFDESRKGIFSSIIRGSGDARRQEFSMADFQEDFVMNMLVYAANSQILQREMEDSYYKVTEQLMEAKSSGCAGCSGCQPK
ncbi:MAG: hypothetical protein Q4E53_11210 [Eubacteriales bacterium]|nr:hypothetical protein [Eubacteriales bacterium]